MESVSVSFQVHIGHQWARCMDDEIIQRYTHVADAISKAAMARLEETKHRHLRPTRRSILMTQMATLVQLM